MCKGQSWRGSDMLIREDLTVIAEQALAIY